MKEGWRQNSHSTKPSFAFMRWNKLSLILIHLSSERKRVRNKQRTCREKMRQGKKCTWRLERNELLATFRRDFPFASMKFRDAFYASLCLHCRCSFYSSQHWLHAGNSESMDGNDFALTSFREKCNVLLFPCHGEVNSVWQCMEKQPKWLNAQRNKWKSNQRSTLEENWNGIEFSSI